MKRSKRWTYALIILLVFLLIYRFTLVPDEEEEVTEAVEEIDFGEVDRIEVFGDKDYKIVRKTAAYELLTEDTTYQIEIKKVLNLLATVNELQNAEPSSIDYEEWSKNNGKEKYQLKLFENTEEVLDVFVYIKSGGIFLRYQEERKIYKLPDSNVDAFTWLDKITTYQREGS